MKDWQRRKIQQEEGISQEEVLQICDRSASDKIRKILNLSAVCLCGWLSKGDFFSKISSAISLRRFSNSQVMYPSATIGGQLISKDEKFSLLCERELENKFLTQERTQENYFPLKN